MPSLNLVGLTESFKVYYICAALRKFTMLLDPLRRGKIAISSILLSPILTEMFELRDPSLPKEYEKSNWFSMHSVLRVYSQFLSMDLDQDGMLSRQELGNYNGGTANPLILDRVYQECLMYNKKMDFNT
jgi:serine/threonine-protein phosphatase 2A regulatory subunit B''